MKRFAVSLLFCAGCLSQVTLERGTTVEISSLQRARGTLRGVLQQKLKTGDPKAAFFVLESMKSQRAVGLRVLATVQKSMTSSVALALGPRRSVGLLSPALDLPAASAVSKARARSVQAFEVRVRDAFWKAQADNTALMERLNARGLPADLAAPQLLATVEELQRGMGPTQAFLSFFVDLEQVHAFIVRRGRFELVSLNIKRSLLRAHAAELLDALSRAGPWEAPSHALYELIWRPLEPALKGVQVLTISPHDALGSVPLQVLAPRGSSVLLIDRFQISYAPSASMYRQLLSKPVFDDLPRILAVGHGVLPNARLEAKTIGRVFKGSVALVGEYATERRLLDLYPGFNILHFATHGLVNERRGIASLLLNAEEGEDGYLSSDEIARMKLDGVYLAVLSACETSVGTGLSSISGAFLLAGTSAVMGSLWKVSDNSTAELMVHFYKGFLAHGTAEALLIAQRNLRSQPQFAHPYYWSAFVLYGWDR